MEQDADNNDRNFPNVSLFSVAMMMMKKVHIVIKRAVIGKRKVEITILY